MDNEQLAETGCAIRRQEFEMTNAEEHIFKMLDRQMAVNPASLTPRQLHIYRTLLSKQVSEMIIIMGRQAPGEVEDPFFDLCLS